MPPIDEPVSFEPKPSAAEARKPKAAAGKPEEPAIEGFVAVTVDPAAGRIVKIERVDQAGERHALSTDETARLVKSDAKSTLERLVEQAFEAGIDCVLGTDAEREEKESAEDAELSRALLRSLIERSAAKRLIQHEVLSRAIVGTLIEQAAAGRVGSESGVAH